MNKYIEMHGQQNIKKIHKLVYIKTFKIAPTCFDPKIIVRELHCSSLKSLYFIGLIM